MIKLAILVCGDYREFEYASNSWFFLNYPNIEADVYISTWSKTFQECKNLKIKIENAITKKSFDFIKNIKKINIGNEETHNSFDNNGQRMLNRWKTAIQEMKKTKIEYDFVFLIRPDLYIEKTPSFDYFLTNIKPGIYGYFDITFMQDICVLGTQKEIEKLLNIRDLNFKGDIHSFLYSEFNRIFKKTINNLNQYNIINVSIYRPNTRFKDQSKLTFEEVSLDAVRWYQGLYSEDIILKKFLGFSGSDVFLIKCNNELRVRKINNINRNYEKLVILKEAGFNVPDIIEKKNNYLDMEFISGYDIKTFFNYTLKGSDALFRFIDTTLNLFRRGEEWVDYTDIFTEFLDFIKDDKKLPFTSDQLIAKLPKILPRSLCHGDFTLENLIYQPTKNIFCMIDPSTGVFDSWIFDLAKLRQDIEGRWFLRKEQDTNLYNYELNLLRDHIIKNYKNFYDDYLYILMLLRVYKYCKNDSFEQTFLLREISKIWK